MERISTDLPERQPQPPRRRKQAGRKRRVDYYEPQAMYSNEAAGRQRSAKATAADAARRVPSAESGNPVSRALRNLPGKTKRAWQSMTGVLSNKRLAFDKPLAVIVLLLLAVGLLMMYSASYAYAYHELKDSTFYIRKQVVFAAVGVVFMYIISTLPPHRFKGKVTYILLGVCYFLLVVVLVTPEIEHVHRWINLGFTTFQPSEIAKFAAILWCATYISNNYKQINVTSYPDAETKARINRSKTKKWFYAMGQNFMVGVLPFLLALGPMLGLIVKEPHLSCTILVIMIIGTQMFVGGVKKTYFGILGVLAAIAIYFVIYTDVVPYGKTRIEVWRDPFVDKLDKGWQNIQSLYAISSGGLFGVGLGNSKQKYLYISEPQNDFIFAVICEEVGLVGAMLIILLFVLFVWRGFAVSLANPDRFCKLVGVGITSQIGFQMILNICVVTKMVPNTGISLPFFSYGGTSLMMLLVEIGVLLAISRTSPNKVI